MGFDVYYLIVWDLCMYAKRRGIWWNVRGSGAGSIVAYAIGVTNLDPLRNKLIFERFLNPGRVTMPDFDLDFPDDQREELIRYTRRQVRQRPGRADRHLRPDEGAGGRARRGPGDGCAADRGRPHRQDDPGHPRQAGHHPGRADPEQRVLLGRAAAEVRHGRRRARAARHGEAAWRGSPGTRPSMPAPSSSPTSR